MIRGEVVVDPLTVVGSVVDIDKIAGLECELPHTKER
jgi:hypothetical protein